MEEEFPWDLLMPLRAPSSGEMNRELRSHSHMMTATQGGEGGGRGVSGFEIFFDNGVGGSPNFRFLLLREEGFFLI